LTMSIRLRKVGYTQAKGEGLSLGELISEPFKELLTKDLADEFEVEVRSISVALTRRGSRKAENMAPEEVFLILGHRSHRDYLGKIVHVNTEDEHVLERVLRAFGAQESSKQTSRGA